MLVDVAASSLVAATALARDEPSGGGEEGFDCGGVDGDDGDKCFSDGPNGRCVDTLNIPTSC